MEIILIRHGKPTSANNLVLNASEYTQWIRRYNFSDVSKKSHPDIINKEINSYYLVSSHLKRAIHSTEIYTGRSPDLISSLYKEMEIPRYKLPFKFKAMTWVFLCRVLWMMGLTGPFESYRVAKKRSKLAAEQLIALAQEQGKVVLFGHGYMNLHIRRVLTKQGWLIKCKSNDFWGVSILKPSTGNKI